MSKFKVGDLVIGNEDADAEYSITKMGWIGEVIGIRDDDDEDVRVKNIEGYTKCECWVDSSYFDLYKKGNHVICADSILIKRVIFNGPATIVFWNDGTKTIVKCQEGDSFDKEKGIALCIAKKVLGNQSNFNNVIKTWIV